MWAQFLKLPDSLSIIAPAAVDVLHIKNIYIYKFLPVLLGRIDRILKDEDLNGDGYITYMEYAKARSTQLMFKHADKIEKGSATNWF